MTDSMLVLYFTIETEALMPCAICNQECRVKIVIQNLCHTEKLSDIKGAVFDYRKVLREGILLELPYKAECNEGDCPERSTLAKYLIQESSNLRS